MGLRPLTYWDGGLETLQGLTCLSLVSVVYCQRALRRADRSFREPYREWSV